MSDEPEEEPDPIDDLADEVSDREGDPFETPAGPRQNERDESRADVNASEAAEPSTGGASDETTVPDANSVEGPTAGSPGQAPPADPGSGSPERGPENRVGDPFAAAERAFQEMDVADLDDDQVWASLDDAQASGSVTQSGERTVADVSKHSYCETCPHFSEPPDIHCTHEGTEILEFPDLETVRVVDCPIVAERRALQREG